MLGVEHGHVRRIRIALALADSVRLVDEFLSREVEPPQRSADRTKAPLVTVRVEHLQRLEHLGALVEVQVRLFRDHFLELLEVFNWHRRYAPSVPPPQLRRASHVTRVEEVLAVEGNGAGSDPEVLADELLRQVVVVCLVNGLPAKVEAVFLHHGAGGVRALGSSLASKHASLRLECSDCPNPIKIDSRFLGCSETATAYPLH